MRRLLVEVAAGQEVTAHTALGSVAEPGTERPVMSARRTPRLTGRTETD
jgi:hypothetical protein